MQKKLALTLSDQAHEAVMQAASGRPAARFLRDALESYAETGAATPGNSLYDRVEKIVDERVKHVVDAKLEETIVRNLKDQTLVELETAELVAERAIKWAKIAGVFLAVPTAVFVALFSFLGVKTYFDL